MSQVALKIATIVLTDAGYSEAFYVLAIDSVLDYHYVGAAAAAVAMSIERVDTDEQHHDNITDWALKQFTAHYKEAAPQAQPERRSGRDRPRASQ